MTNLLLVCRQLTDELLVQHLVNWQPRILLVQVFVCHHRLALAVAHRRQTLFLNAVLNQVVAATLRTFLTQVLVELVITLQVRVRTQLNRDIRVIVQQLNQAVQLILRRFRQLPSTELIEHILHLHRPTNRTQRKIHRVRLAVLQSLRVPLFLGVQVTACRR